MVSSRKLLLAGSSLAVLAPGLVTPYDAWADTTISNTTAAYSWSSGNLSVTNTGTITGIDNSYAAAITIGSGVSAGTFSNSGTISSGTSSLGPGISNSGSIKALSNSGTISGCTGCAGVSNAGSIGTVSNNGTITGNTGIFNSGSIGTVVNAGTIISSSGFGISNGSLSSNSIGTIGLLNNSGLVSGLTGLINAGSIATVTNTGTITGNTGIFNSGNVGTIVNAGTIISSSGFGIYNGSISSSAIGTIGLLNNSSLVSGTTGLLNAGSIGTVTNSGTIKGTADALINRSTGSIGIIANTGTLTGAINAVDNSGSIASLVNNGVISATGNSGIAIANAGSIGTIANQAGATISGYEYAIANAGVNTSTVSGNTSTSGSNGSITMIANSGVIAGNIANNSTNALTISGGGGGTYGTLTGYTSGTAGTITSNNANVVFSSGNILLNDRVNVGSYSVVNSGATIQVTSNSTITGNYVQTGGGLVVATSSSGSSYSSLVVGGSASVTGSTITISGSGLTKGETFVVVNPSGSGSYSNDSVSVVGTNGLSGSVSTAGGELVVTLGTTNYASIAATAGGTGSAMGSFLTNALNSGNSALVASQSTEIAYLSTLSQGQQATAIKQLAPIQMTPAAVAATTVNITTSAIETHQLAMTGDGGAGMAAGSSGHDYALWGQFLGGASTRGTTATTDGFRTRDFGLVAGLDYVGDADVSVGGALSWVRGWNWGAGDSTGDFAQSDSYQATAYGQHRWNAAFIDAQFSLGYTTTSQRRVFNLGANANHADYDGRLYVARLGGGYDIPLDRMTTVTPMIGWRYVRVVSGGYQETGATELWKVNQSDVHTWTHDIGGKVTWTLATDWGRVTPELRLAWIHDYNQSPMTTYAFQYGLPSATVTNRTAADGVRFNAAAELAEVGDVTLRLEYQGEVRPNYQSHSGLVKASIGF